jgi:glutamate dehydrogenase/leucine dehydrogenase
VVERHSKYQKAQSLGATVVAMCDSSGYIYDGDGILLSVIQDTKEVRRGRIKEYLDAPSKAADAGGVAISALEMSQNSQRMGWTFEEFDSRLLLIMKNICKNVSDAAAEYGAPGDLR